MSAREEVLARVRSALVDVVQPDPVLDVPIAWKYGQPIDMPDVLGTFVEMVEDYKAVVRRVPAAAVPAEITSLLKERGVTSMVVPAGVDASWRQAVVDAGVTVREDDPPLDRVELNSIDGVLTASRVGIADTGTIVLDHREDQGRRALSLVPDLHLCVIAADQVVSDVSEAVARLDASIKDGRPLTWISGGSATSDIELNRVEGVHGPRTLLVVLAE